MPGFYLHQPIPVKPRDGDSVRHEIGRAIMDRKKKTAAELEATIRIAAPELKAVKFNVVAEKSAGGWTTVVSGSQTNLAALDHRLKQIVDTLVGLYELQE